MSCTHIQHPTISISSSWSKKVHQQPVLGFRLAEVSINILQSKKRGFFGSSKYQASYFSVAHAGNSYLENIHNRE